MESGGVGRWRDRVPWWDVGLAAKTALAAVIAWLLASELLDLPQPFLAPWAALLVVHATVYRTMSRGVQQIAATVAAVVLASAAGHLMGMGTGAVAVVIAIGLLAGLLPWLRAESVTVAATGVVVLTTGIQDEVMLWSRLADTGIGVATGLVVNLLVWPPLADRSAAGAIDDVRVSIGELLTEIGTTLEESISDDDLADWLEDTRRIDGQINHAWARVRQARESARMNPRRKARGLRDPQRWSALVRRMEQAVAETRSMVGTLQAPSLPRDNWDSEFARSWIPLLRATGEAVRAAEASSVHEVRLQITELGRELSERDDWSPLWPVYGALIVNLRNILDSLDEVPHATKL